MITHLPSAIEIERMILGYALMKPANMDAVRGAVDCEDFVLEKHRLIWMRMCSLFDSGQAVDRVVLFNELMGRGEDGAVGGLSYIVELNTGLPDIVQFDGYIDILHQATLRRRMILAANTLASRACDESENAEEVLHGFSQALTDLFRSTNESRRPISTAEMIATEGVDALLSPRNARGINLPWPRLNEALCGLDGGQMIVLMAATSRGKTSMALQVATAASIQQFTPIIWTMEMSPRSQFQRMVTQLSGVYAGKRSLTFEEREGQRNAVVHLNDNPIYFDRHSKTIGSFLASIRQVRAQRKPGLAIVDHLQLIRSSGRNRAHEVSEHSRALKLAAGELDIPFLVLSQVDRSSVKGDGEIGLHSAKESGDIENDADVVMWIKSEELKRDEDTHVKLHVGKQREGPAGFSIPMVFRPQYQNFLEVEGES